MLVQIDIEVNVGHPCHCRPKVIEQSLPKQGVAQYVVLTAQILIALVRPPITAEVRFFTSISGESPVGKMLSTQRRWYAKDIGRRSLTGASQRPRPPLTHSDRRPQNPSNCAPSSIQSIIFTSRSAMDSELTTTTIRNDFVSRWAGKPLAFIGNRYIPCAPAPGGPTLVFFHCTGSRTPTFFSSLSRTLLITTLHVPR